MKRHLYEVALSEKELREIIGSLCGVEVNEQVAQERQVLAKRLEIQLWQPFHESVAIGRKGFRK
jgi:hypothetical protein